MANGCAGTKARGRELALEAALAVAGYAALTLALMWPVVPAPRTKVYGVPSDPVSEVWRLGQFRNGEIGLVADTVSKLANFPSGVALRRALAAIAVADLSLLDIAQEPPDPATDLGTFDPVAVWLDHGVGAVAEYPLYGFYHHGIGPYLLRQLRHGRPLLNGSIPGTLSADLAMAAGSLESSQVRAALTPGGVSEVVVDSRRTSPAAEASHWHGSSSGTPSIESTRRGARQ